MRAFHVFPLLIGILYSMGCVAGGAQEGMTPLLRAARAGDLIELDEQLAKTTDIDQTSKYGWTALMFAARQGHDKVVVRLLDAGANPNLVSKRIAVATTAPYPATTALAEAIANKHLAIASTLLERGASPDARSVALAGGLDDLSLLRKMHAKGAKLNPGRGGQHGHHRHGSSPLSLACKNGNLENVRWLVEHGADPAAGALMVAVGNDRVQITRYLVGHDKEPAKVPAEQLTSALMHGATKLNTKKADYPKNLQVIQLLLAAGADRNHRPTSGRFQGRTALEFLQAQRVKSLERVERQVGGGPHYERALLEHRDKIIQLLEGC